jgi:thioredoxin reductase
MPSALLNNEATDNNYDVIIVGGSHAGLSAALTLYRALHRCVIFDSSKPRDTSGAPVHLTSAWDGADAEKLKDAQVSELKSTGLIDFVSRAVVSAKKQSDGTFEVVDDRNVLWRGKKMLLAIGMQEVFPDIAGYAENYGSTMSEILTV